MHRLLLTTLCLFQLACTNNSRSDELEKENAELRLQKENIELKNQLDAIKQQKAEVANQAVDQEYQAWKRMRIEKSQKLIREAEARIEEYENTKSKEPFNPQKAAAIQLDKSLLPQSKEDLQLLIDDKVRDLWYSRRAEGYYGDPLP